MAGLVQLSSPDFAPGAPIPARCSVDGGNAAPALRWPSVPDGTEELALLCEDPDTGVGTWIHWVVAGIDPATRSIEDGVLPAGAVEGVNDFGERGYGGPQPVPGTGPHRYFFNLYALKRPSQLAVGCSADDLRQALVGNEIARGVLLGTFEA